MAGYEGLGSRISTSDLIQSLHIAARAVSRICRESIGKNAVFLQKSSWHWSHLSTSKIMHFGSSKVCPASGHPIPFTLAPNLSTSARGRTTNIFQQLAGYSKQCEFALPPKCRSWNSLIAENKLPICKEFVLSNNGIAKCGFVGNNPPFRCMTTVGHPEPSSGQGSSASSPDIVQPQRIKFKRLDKTAKHIMNILDKEAVEKVQSDREIPDIRPGYIIQLKVEVPENKRRVSILKGIVIARRNAGLHTTFRLRRLVASVGVESVFPLYSPNIKEMKVLDKKKVRRAKLYYLRDRMNALKK